MEMESEYFVLIQDPYYSSAIQFPIRQYCQYSRSIQQADYSKLRRSQVVLVKPSSYNLYPDILSRQVFMVKQNILDVILLFNQDMQYSTRYLMDKQNKNMHPYFIPHLQAIDCLSDRANNRHGAHSIKVVLDRNKIQREVHIFQISDMSQNTVVVSLAVLEAILRRKPEMIAYIRIEMDEVK